MSTYVLVHGAWHGEWCWHKVVPELQAAGHEVVAFDLPAHGIDDTPIEDVTLDSHVERISDAVREQSEPVILVGHSMAGVEITEVAEAVPERVERLVYLSAFLPEDGEALIDYAEADEASVVTQNLVVDEERGIVTVEDDAIRAAFYADCSEADIRLAQSLLRPEPLAGMVTPVDTSEERFGSVPRTYVTCQQDRAITPEMQQQMLDALPCEEVRTMDTSHSPFLSAPEELAEILLDVQ